MTKNLCKLNSCLDYLEAIQTKNSSQDSLKCFKYDLFFLFSFDIGKQLLSVLLLSKVLILFSNSSLVAI